MITIHTMLKLILMSKNRVEYANEYARMATVDGNAEFAVATTTLARLQAFDTLI